MKMCKKEAQHGREPGKERINDGLPSSFNGLNRLVR